MLTSKFWSDSFERAVRTFAQTVLAGFGGASLNIWTANWHQVIGLGLGASVLSVLMSIDRSGTSSTAQQPQIPVVTCADKTK